MNSCTFGLLKYSKWVHTCKIVGKILYVWLLCLIVLLHNEKSTFYWSAETTNVAWSRYFSENVLTTSWRSTVFLFAVYQQNAWGDCNSRTWIFVTRTRTQPWPSGRLEFLTAGLSDEQTVLSDRIINNMSRPVCRYQNASLSARCLSFSLTDRMSCLCLYYSSLLSYISPARSAECGSGYLRLPLCISVVFCIFAFWAFKGRILRKRIRTMHSELNNRYSTPPLWCYGTVNNIIIFMSDSGRWYRRTWRTTLFCRIRK